MKKFNVFISWSGSRSRTIAETFRDWLPMVIQAAEPWMSRSDADKGSRGLHELAKALEGIKVGISCLTPENLAAPWILYEAGALTKTVDDKTRLCTYLLGGLKNENIEPPLGQFQHTSPEKEDTRHLVRTINSAISDDPIPEKRLDVIFDKNWPDLETKILSLPETSPTEVTKRSPEDMIAEILEVVRGLASRTPPFPYDDPAQAAATVTHVPLFAPASQSFETFNNLSTLMSLLTGEKKWASAFDVLGGKPPEETPDEKK